MVKAFCDRCGRESKHDGNRVVVLYITECLFNIGVNGRGYNPNSGDGSFQNESSKRLGYLCDPCISDILLFAKTEVPQREVVQEEKT